MKTTQSAAERDANYKKVEAIRSRLSRGEDVTFNERNIVNIFDKRRDKQRKIAAEKAKIDSQNRVATPSKRF